MVDIDRTAKAIVLPDGSILPYDYLVIAPEFGDQSLEKLGDEARGVRGAFSLFDEDACRAAAAFLDSSFNIRTASRVKRRCISPTTSRQRSLLLYWRSWSRA